MPELKFVDYLKTLRPDDWYKMVTDKWTVKDVVAHMVGWEKEDVKVIPETWQTKQVPWFCKTDDYEEFNNKNIELYKDYTPEQLIAEWEKYQGLVDKEIAKIGLENLKKYPKVFGWLLEEGDGSHYELHYQEIKETVNRK